MSMVRLLVYSNQYDIEGLVATTSTWMRQRVRPDVIRSVIDAYEQVQPNLLKHEPGFPDAAALRAIVSSGQPSYGMEAVGASKTSEGAAALVRAADRNDPRPLWIACWGGTNTLAQALMDVRASRPATDLNAFIAKLRVYSISDQDDAGAWIRREFPSLFYIVSPSTPDGEQYYMATWTGISGDRFYRNAPGADFTTFSDEWVNANIRSRGPLGKLYPKPCCIHEGDTPSFLALIGNGLDAFMSPSWGGWGGRFRHDAGGHFVDATGQAVSLGGHLVADSGQRVAVTGQAVCLGGQRVSATGHLVSLGGHLVSLGGHFVALGGQAVSLAGHLV